jgi:hypothetical protein
MNAWLGAAWLLAAATQAPAEPPAPAELPAPTDPRTAPADAPTAPVGAPAAPVGAPTGPVGASGSRPVATEPTPSSLFAPPRPRYLTRVEAVVRPFLGLVGNTMGAINDARLEHYFGRPFMVGVEMSPIAVAYDPHGTGVITHVRLHAAYVTNLLSVGFGVGERYRRFGTSGVSLAPTLRLGSLDGLNLSLEYVYNVARNQYSGKPTLGFSNVTGALAVPLSRRLAFTGGAGFSLDVWLFLTAGLRERLTGDGGPGTWLASAGFGFAWVSDRTVCNFRADSPCPSGSSLTYGPTVTFGLERRF